MDSVKQKIFHRRVEVLELITVSYFHYWLCKNSTAHSSSSHPTHPVEVLRDPSTQDCSYNVPTFYSHTFLTHTI